MILEVVVYAWPYPHDGGPSRALCCSDADVRTSDMQMLLIGYGMYGADGVHFANYWLEQGRRMTIRRGIRRGMQGMPNGLLFAVG
jgi:hypothetical protein